MNTFDFIYPNMIRVVVAQQDNGNNWTCLPCSNDPGLTPANADKEIVCHVLNGVKLIPGVKYIAFQISKGFYVIHNQSVFLELS